MSAQQKQDVSPGLIVSLADAHRYPRTVVGGKASMLGRLMSEGFNVPPGHVITTEAWNDRNADELPDEVERLLDTEQPRAVRSSSTSEDGILASFAGQFHSILNVRGLQEARAAVRKCWSSGEGAAMNEYVARIGVEPGPVAVVVQEMVDADSAGVAFTVDPVTGKSAVVIEAVEGLGDQLLDGNAQPERWSWEDAPVCHTTPHALQPEQVEEIVATCERLVELLGAPQDVEWAYCGDELFILQSRPVTALPIEPTQRPPANQCWERDDAHFPTPALPLAASFWLPVHAQCLGTVAERAGFPFDTVRTRVFGGRVYARVEPLGDGGKGRDDRAAPPKWLFWLLMRLAPPFRKRMAHARRAVAEDLPMKLVEAWETEGRAADRSRTIALRNADRAAMSDAELADHFEEIREHARAAGLAHFELAIISGAATTGALGRFVQRELGWTVSEVLDLLQGYGHSSVEAGEAIERLAEVIAQDEEALRLLREAPHELRSYRGTAGEALRGFLDDRGHCLRDMSIDQPLWAEDPTALLVLLRRRTDGAGEHGDPLAIAEAAEARLREELPDELWPDAERLLQRARRARPLQDETEGTSMEAMAVLRYAALEAAERLEASGLLRLAEDIWLVEFEELVHALRAGELHADIERRRGEMRWARANELPRQFGPTPQPPPDLEFPADVDGFLGGILWFLASDLAEPEPLPDADLTGVGCSPGVATGRVRVIDAPDELHRLEPGEILVCRGTTAAWSFAFPLIAGLITELGGPLSHPATLAREYGIPGVLSAPEATKVLRNGELVTIDGRTGAIRRVT